MPLKSGVTRSELRLWHDQVSAKLAARRLHVLSYNVDGVETERGLTHEIQRDAFQVGRAHTWTFKHPVAGQPALSLKVPLLENGKPCIMSTDGKHAKKNGRGSATSGARGLILGRYPVHFGQFAKLAEGKNSPLLKSDIIGVDKQDDRAAARLFSSATIEYISVVAPEELGLVIYLWIIGEVVDAQQSRDMTHLERSKILWRAHFFLDAWRQYVIDHPHYSLHTHFITRELYDILSIFINAMLLLILVHRDFFPDVPLLHWLNSTEPCEHVFGCARKIQKDFTFVEWILMIPKVATLVGGELRRKMKGAQEGASASRYGYHHSYFESDDINLPNLATFPSNDDLEEIIRVAHTEADALLKILGMNVTAPSLVDNDSLESALETLCDDVQVPTTTEHAAAPSPADELASALLDDSHEFSRGWSNGGVDEPMANIGIQATATTIHDMLHM